MPAESRLLGYEILGYELSRFHSFICNSLEQVYFNKLQIKLNENGLIQDIKDAEKATVLTNVPNVAEPVLWQPWAVYAIE